MKNKHIIFILFLFQFSFSQTPGKIEYAPVGAKWVYELGYNYPYDWYLYGYKGFIEYTVEKDTSILILNQNVVCKKIIVSNYNFNWNNSIFYEYLPYTCFGKYTLTFKRNDTLFWLVNSNDKSNKFYPVLSHYNQLGSNKNFWYFTSLCWNSQYFNFPFSISATPYSPNEYLPLLDIDTLLVLNDTLRKYKFNLPGFPDNNAYYYLENIGFLTAGLIPYSTEKFIDNNVSVFGLRCYYDPVNGWINFNMNDCYYIKPGSIDIKEYSKEEFGFYYSNNKIYFHQSKFSFPLKISIYDLLGRKFFETTIENAQPLDLNLNSGAYIMETNRKILKFIIE